MTDELTELTLTTEHASSSYGRPVLVVDGQAYGPGDRLPDGRIAGDLVQDWADRFTSTRRA